MRRLNVEKLQGVLRNHGIRIKNDDPVFTLLALNEIALDRMIYSQRQTLARYIAQRRLSVSVLLLTAGAGVGAGTLLGRGGSYLITGVSGLILGALLIGLAIWLGLRAIPNNRFDPAPLIPKKKQVNPFVWTEMEFNRVAENKAMALSLRTKAACFDVLIRGVDIEIAAATQKMGKEQLARGLGYFNEQMHKM